MAIRKSRSPIYSGSRHSRDLFLLCLSSRGTTIRNVKRFSDVLDTTLLWQEAKPSNKWPLLTMAPYQRSLGMPANSLCNRGSWPRLPDQLSSCLGGLDGHINKILNRL